MEELFEFDLSDVDVAAFESVATTPPPSSSPPPPPQPPPLEQQQQQQSTEESIEVTLEQQDHQKQHQQQLLHHQATLAPPQPLPPHLTTSQDHQHQLQQLQQQHLQQQIVTATGQQKTCKILLIPLNTTSKHLFPNLKTTSSSVTPKNEDHFQTPPQQPTTNVLNTTNMIANDVPKRKPCNCTKSQCLKLYCDCFANGEFCSGCNCTNCFNSLSKEKERQKAITQCLERNPEAFRPKIGKAIKSNIGEPAPDSIERRHTKGCNCKRSGCLKNYCECYEAKILCSNLCKCCGCKNYEESFERKSLMQLVNSSSESARGILKNLLPTNNNHHSGREFKRCFMTDRVITASLACLLQSAQQAEKDGMQANKIPGLIQLEMGKCLRMIADSVTESSNSKKR